MKISLISSVSLFLLLTSSILTAAQTTPLQPASDQQPVSYASVTQVNNILNQVEQTAQSAQVDLARLRIDKWKTDSNSKRQAQSNVEALSRNLKTARSEETRLNSSHVAISYAVFCLKKKNKQKHKESVEGVADCDRD